MKFYFETCFLEKSEYAKIVSEINTNYKKYRGQRLSIHISHGLDNHTYWYYFENFGFNHYNIYAKIRRD